MKTILAILVLAFSSRQAAAQYSYSASLTGNVSVYAIQSLTFTGGSVIPSFNSLDDYINGVVANNYVSVGVKSNVSWTLSVQAESAFFTPSSQSGSTNMPCSVLSVKQSGSNNYIPLSTNSQTIKTGNKGGLNNAGNSFGLDLRYNPGFMYKGDIYNLGLIYTLTHQ
ncbi:MAG: hypothetical protein JST52_01235 [Bacteroidetes bacterium]|nr:hypothetical protein [Bacteroidota bacterium]MBS1739209.1 hypothetical protein [Bacteroidota bacterium]MBS1775658.1 hypothetical protein [Bacteroidota bacterium]